MKQSGCNVPDWMLSLKNPTKSEKKDLKRKAVERQSVKTISSYDEKRQRKKREMIAGSKRRAEKFPK